MRALDNVSLGRKLTLIIMLTSTIALLLACAAVAVFDLLSFRQASRRDLAVLAAMLGENCKAALIFDDSHAATQVLEALETEPQVVASVVYRKDGRLFAQYFRAGASPHSVRLPQREGAEFTNDGLVEWHRIQLGNEDVGSIYIESDLQEMKNRLREYAEIVVLVTLCSSFIAFSLGVRLQKWVSGPILDLVETTGRISSEKNYSLRARTRGTDELGVLVSSFNSMLDQIQGRDQELKRQRADLQHEVAARTAINTQLEMAKEAAEAASRAKGEFLANVSHEIRTPINGILGMTELALDTDLTHEQRDYLLLARSSGESLLSVINDILDFSKVESGKLDLEQIEFGLYDCVGETMKTLAFRAHEKGLELIYDVRPEVPSQIIGDPGRLRQILVNLVGNAIKFTSKGEVLVEIDRVTESGETLELHFRVTDTGTGVPLEKQQIIFQPFSQADTSTTRHFGGTGLGLAICTQLVKLMQGRIWLESEPGKGSTFHFTAKFLRASIETPSPMPVTELQDVPVLLVDDNATNRKILGEVTQNWGMKPSAVENGAAALSALQRAAKEGDPFQVVLLDASMPGKDGFQVAEEIIHETQLKNPTIVMLTSAGRPGEGTRCRELGIAAYLLKPVHHSDLKNAIRKALGSRGSVPGPQLVTRHTLRESGVKFRILVAEDNAVNQALIVRVLEKMGHLPVIAQNGKEAVSLATTQKFDVIFMDVQMPEMDGLAATVAIRETEKRTGTHIPIYAMTARVMKGDREECLKVGMDGYIPKPVRFGDIQRTLSNLSEEQAPQPIPIASRREIAPAWERAEALERVGGDEELLRELCQIFLGEYPKLLANLREAITMRDAEGVQRAAHSLKGEVSYLGAAIATETAKRLEDMGRARDLTHAFEELASLEKALNSLRSAIEHPAEVR
jgi:two-component system, sensor histidine kinase and response regulator